MHEDLGFKLEIKTEDLKAILLKRVEHHRSREKFYLEEAKKFANDREVVEQGHSNRRMGTHQEELERSAKIHADTAKYLDFIAQHLPDVNRVELTNSALHTLEILE